MKVAAFRGSEGRAKGAGFRPGAVVRVAVLIESSRSYGRGLLRGVAQYARERAKWRIDYQERELHSGLPKWLEHWRGQGVLARIEDDVMARGLVELGVPIVDLRRMACGSSIASLHTDEIKVTQLVIAHFQERGFRNFGFCGFKGLDYSDFRAELFSTELASRGYRCAVYVPRTAFSHLHTVDYEQDGMESEDHLARWLRRLPKPIGIMACNDIRGQQVLNACRGAGIAVPEQVAVMGVDNDEVLCELSDPPLSSVAPDTRRLGYEAAALLDRFMRGETVLQKDYYIEPLGIVTRRSTDTLVIPHEGAAQALSFLRRHYQERITLKDLAANLRFTLRSIQDVFKEHVGRSLHAELNRLRISHGKILLQDPKLKLEAVATACGFSNPKHLRRAFLLETGQTPQRYRRSLKEPFIASKESGII